MDSNKISTYIFLIKYAILKNTDLGIDSLVIVFGLVTKSDHLWALNKCENWYNLPISF